ncbi:MAG: serine/threonine protein kinase [Streptosporangiaceae bacterium]|nr:serine/threonine protein kinase [Streptosporangiaceae bacterium]
MSTYTSEPGTRLAGRYRLVDQTSAGPGWTYWKATDETLARPVTVLTFAPGFPRITEAVTAARTASRLNDSRFAQVFDVEDSDELAYVVLEWVAGESLIDMLADGPLDPPRAVALIAEAAQALAVAHRAGQAHLRLEPVDLHWTPGGGVKICGLGIDAALAGPNLTGPNLTGPELSNTDLSNTELIGAEVTGMGLTDAEDPELIDTRNLARLLYAALTGYWPGPGTGQLPPAPTDSEGGPCTPRQVAAGVPAGIDSVTCRALFQQQNRQGPPLSTPAAFADALIAIAPPVSPVPFGPQRAPADSYRTDPYGADGYGAGGHRADGHRRSGPTSPYPLAGSGGVQSSRSGPATSGYRRRHPATERSAVARGVVSVVIVLVLAAIGVTAWAISRSLHHAAPPQTARQQQSSSGPSAAAVTVLKPSGAAVYNPLDKDPNSDDPGQAQYALGGSPGQFWHTSYYDGNPQFGGLKKGAGLLVDMGSSVQLSQLTVKFGASCCGHVSIGIGNSNSLSAMNSFTTVGSTANAAGTYTFNITSKATGRYVLIWFTSLPPLNNGTYQAQIYDVIARGTS